MRTAHWILLTGGLVLTGLLAVGARLGSDREVAPALERLVAGQSSGSELHVTWSRTKDPDHKPIAFPGNRRRPIIPPRWDGMLVSLEVLVDGRPLSTVHYRGHTYLPVPRLGAEYQIRVSNQGPRRIGAIVSVDGLSVINGRPSCENQAGYLVAPRSAVVIHGWRRDLNTVAAFSFQDRERSYASRVGHPENVGVIGLIAIEEQVRFPRPYLDSKGRAAPEARKSAAGVGSTGTGYGRDIDSPAYYVPFARSANKRMIVFYYDTVEALRQAGVPVDDRLPIAFPKDPDFVPPPPK